jgi:hypothetical protein
MDYGRGIAHPALMIGEGFILTILHNEVEKDVGGKKQKITYANIKDASGNWQVGAPVRVDEEGETQPLKIMAATVEERCLLWDAPDMDQWNSLYIPGTRTKKVEGQEVEVSKNWLQQLVTEAVNFEGSPVQTLIASLGGDPPDVSGDVGGIEDGDDDFGQDDGSDEDEGAGEAPAGSDEDDPLAGLELE